MSDGWPMFDKEKIEELISNIAEGGKPWNDTLIYDLREAVVYLLEQLKNKQPEDI